MVNYSRISPEAGMVMKRASGDNLPSVRVPGRAQISPRRWRRLWTSFWIFLAIFRVFHPGGLNRRSGGVGAGPGGPHLCQARPARLGRAWARCGPPVASLLLPFGHLESSGVKLRKIVSFSNSENICLSVILKPKTVENRNWPLWHLVNRLVAGNQ